MGEELPQHIAEVEFDDVSSIDGSTSSAQSSDQVHQEEPLSGHTGRTVSPDAEILPEVELYEELVPEQTPSEAAVPQVTPPDGRDQPLSIPDHVLTPTLADIYYQQGQHQLAAQIYQRLLERDPENDQLIARIREIQSAIEQNTTPEPQQNGSFSHRRTTARKGAGRNRSSAGKRGDSRPLAGIHLKKQVKNAAKSARKRKS